jgi:hypothetical protein
MWQTITYRDIVWLFVIVRYRPADAAYAVPGDIGLKARAGRGLHFRQ